jgi:glyoxylase-like metal-dependent hydrolase (beta-lactamase superfamily II)
MTEPRTLADRIEQLAPGLWWWSIHDERIDFVSCSYAVSSVAGAVMIDPLPLEADALAQLGTIAAICLTAGSHQRSTWRYRRELGAPVYAPALSKEIDEEPDERYGDGARLPGELGAVFTPGAGTTQHSLLHEPTGALFVPDLLLRPEEGDLILCPAEYAHDPEEQRRSVEKLLDLPFSTLCLAHGAPVREDPQAAIRAALAAYASS